MKALLLLFFISTTVLANETLSRIQAVTAQTHNPVVIFDLDDTLFYSSSRSMIIFKELVESSKFLKKYPEQLLKVAKIQESQIQYSIKETLLNSGITNEDFIKEALTFWKSKFFTNEYVKEDTPVEGGREYVLGLRKLGAKIIYLTGRDNTMRSGTIESLEDSGFPIDGKNSILITKERFDIPDIDYKKSAFRKIEKLGNVIAFFENEPKNLNAMIEYFKDGVAVLLDIKHSPAPVVLNSKTIKVKNYLLKKPISTCLPLNGGESEKIVIYPEEAHVYNGGKVEFVMSLKFTVNGIYNFSREVHDIEYSLELYSLNQITATFSAIDLTSWDLEGWEEDYACAILNV